MTKPTFDELLAGAKELNKQGKGAVNCTYTLAAQGKAYPRTCQRCGLGPCAFQDYLMAAKAEPEITNGQQYANDYTAGADEARRIVSYLDNKNRAVIYTMIRDALNDAHTQRDRLIAALTPSGDTKAAYMGEVRDDVMTTVVGEDGEWEEVNLKPYVSWTAIKEVMALIRKEAGL